MLELGPGFALSVRCVRAREGQAVPCFFPLAGSAVGATDVSGFYWSCPVDGPGSVDSQRLTLLPSSAAVSGGASATAPYSVRCVRAREEQAVPCFFPLAGSAVAPGELCGYYWTTDFVPNAGTVYLRLDGATVRYDFAANGELFSVRCVRAREGQAVPLFWIVWFWVFEIRGIGRSPGHPFGMPPERVWPVQ